MTGKDLICLKGSLVGFFFWFFLDLVKPTVVETRNLTETCSNRHSTDGIQA